MVCVCNLNRIAWSEEWRKPTVEESFRIGPIVLNAFEEDDESAWSELRAMPPHVFLSEMMQSLPSLRRKPESFERFRNMVLSTPGWEEWMQWKIDSYHQGKPTDQRGTLSDPDGLTWLAEFIRMVGTVETVPLLAQYLSFPYFSPPNYGYVFQHSSATTLRDMQIPGAPNSVDPEDWRKWWKAKEHLYKKGPDGKIHGPAPTRFVIMNGKLPPLLPLPPPIPAKATTYFTGREATPAPPVKPAPSAPPIEPVVVPPAPLATNRWPPPSAIAAGIAALALLCFWLRRRRA